MQIFGSLLSLDGSPVMSALSATSGLTGYLSGDSSRMLNQEEVFLERMAHKPDGEPSLSDHAVSGPVIQAESQQSISDMKKNITTECHKLVFGLQCFVQIALIYNKFLGVAVNEAPLRDIYSKSVDDADRLGSLKKHLFADLHKRLSVEFSEDDSLCQICEKTYAWMRGQGLLLLCTVAYSFMENVVFGYLARRIDALNETYIQPDDKMTIVQHQDFLLDTVEQFLMKHQGEAIQELSQRDVIKGLLEILIPIIDDRDLLSYIPASVRSYLLDKLGVIDLIDEFISTVNSTLYIERAGKQYTYALDIAIAKLLKNLVNDTSAKEEREIPKADQERKDKITRIYHLFFAEVARVSPSVLNCTQEVTSLLEAFMISNIAIEKHEIKDKVINSCVTNNLDVIDDLLKMLLREQFLVKTTMTSLTNLNEALFMPKAPEPSAEATEEAFRERQYQVRMLLAKIVRGAVEGLWEEKVLANTGGWIRAGLAWFGDKTANVARRSPLVQSLIQTATQDLENLIQGIFNLLIAKEFIPGLIQTLGNNVLAA